MKLVKNIVAISVIFTLFSFTNLKPNDTNEKIELPSLTLVNYAIDSIAADISNQISKAQYGHQWPVTKMVFSKADGTLFIDVTAIDNSWFRLFSLDEKPYGHFVSNNRLFIVSVKNEEQPDLSSFFEKTSETRSFDKPEISITLFKEMPSWSFQYANNNMQLINTMYLDQLIKLPRYK